MGAGLGRCYGGVSIVGWLRQTFFSSLLLSEDTSSPAGPAAGVLYLLHRHPSRSSRQPWTTGPYQRKAQRTPQPTSPGLVPNSQEGEDVPFTEGPCPGLDRQDRQAGQTAAARQAGYCPHPRALPRWFSWTGRDWRKPRASSLGAAVALQSSEPVSCL